MRSPLTLRARICVLNPSRAAYGHGSRTGRKLHDPVLAVKRYASSVRTVGALRRQSASKLRRFASYKKRALGHMAKMDLQSHRTSYKRLDRKIGAPPRPSGTIANYRRPVCFGKGAKHGG